jgi:hypothetical protein
MQKISIRRRPDAEQDEIRIKSETENAAFELASDLNEQTPRFKIENQLYIMHCRRLTAIQEDNLKSKYPNIVEFLTGQDSRSASEDSEAESTSEIVPSTAFEVTVEISNRGKFGRVIVKFDEGELETLRESGAVFSLFETASIINNLITKAGCEHNGGTNTTILGLEIRAVFNIDFNVQSQVTNAMLFLKPEIETALREMLKPPVKPAVTLKNNSV